MNDTPVISPARASDLGLVYDAWRDSFYDAHAAGPWPGDVYRAACRETIARILAQPDTVVLVARSPRDEDTLYGFIAASANAKTLYYVDVKAPYRGRGNAAALMAAAGFHRTSRFVYWFKTSVARAFLAKGWPGARFDPMPARRLRREETP